MNPAIITYYDIREWPFASCSYETAKNFATVAGFDMVAEPSGGVVSGAISGNIMNTGSFNPWAYAQKIELCIRELNAGRPYVVWADTDIIFNAVPDTSFLSLYTASFTATTVDFVVPESSFFIAYPEALPLLTAWSASYSGSGNADTDEQTLVPLFVRTRYSGSLAPSVGLLPALPYMASPMNNLMTGSIGKHFYMSLLGFSASLFLMKQYKKQWFG